VNPSLLLAFVSGAGYFVKNKVYQTIAEAQEPGMSELVLSFGWFTFYLGLGAIAIMIWQTPRRNNPAFTMLVFWTLGSLFMALSAARFIFNAAPVFAVATGYAIDLILIRMDFAGMRRTYRSLAEGNRRNALRKSIKMRHVLTVLFVAFLILLPNTWFAIDAAIPFELKGTYDRQVNALLPPFLQAPGYAQSVQNRGTFYFGAFGYSLPRTVGSTRRISGSRWNNVRP
jgi:dolichyl-diphosphooligosaccharide--protein glycosyltransferase